MSEFVIVVDAQADFMCEGGALPVPGAAALIAPLDRFLASLSPHEVAGVLFTFDTHDPDTYPSSAEARQFPPHCYRGTPGWASVLDPAALDPAIPRYRLEKNVFDMWADPDVTIEPVGLPDAAAIGRDTFFARHCADGIERVVVVGVAADYCVRWAVEGLIARGFTAVIPAALTAGIERDAVATAAAIGSAKVEIV